MDVLGIIGFLIGVAGFSYGIYAKRQADEIAKGSIMGADEVPTVSIVRSHNGFGVMLMSESRYPHFGIRVRTYDFASDNIIDPTKMGMGAFGNPMIQLPDLYPNTIQGQPFYEIDLRQIERVRVNLFLHTRNAQSHIEIVAIRNGDDSKVAYKQWFSESKETVRIPDGFPIENPEEPASLFSEDEPTGTTYFKNQDGQLVAVP